MTPEEYGLAYEKNFNFTVRFLQSKGILYDEAQEMAQAAWARGWERIAQLRDPDKISTWMNSIAFNLCLMDFRRSHPTVSLDTIRLADSRHDGAPNIEKIDVRLILRRCPEGERSILTMYYLKDHPVWKISKITGWSKTAVKIRLFRARKKARERAT